MQLCPDTARLLRLILSSLVAAAMGIGSNLLSTLNASPSLDLPPRAILIAVITGLLLFCKDIQSYLATPPVVGMPTSVPVEPPVAPVILRP